MSTSWTGIYVQSLSALRLNRSGRELLSDLFDEATKSYVTDIVLLFDLAAWKLGAEAVCAEGWKWVEVTTSFDYSGVSVYRRAYSEPRPLTDAVFHGPFPNVRSC